MTARRRCALGALALASIVVTSGCARGCTSSRPPIHLNPSMDNQPKCCRRRPAPSSTTARRCASRCPARSRCGGLKEDSAFFTGKGADGQVRRHEPGRPSTTALLERGASATRSIASRVTTRAATARASCSSAATCRPPPSTRTKILELPGRADLRRHHQRPGADARATAGRFRRPTAGRSSPTCESSSASGRRAPRPPPRKPRSERGAAMNFVMNRKRLVLVGPILVLVMFAGVATMVSMVMSQEYRDPYRVAAGGDRHDAARAGRGGGKGGSGSEGAGEALRGSRVPEVPRRRQPRRDLGGGAAAPAVRGVRAGGADLRVHHRGDRLQDRRPALRPARARVLAGCSRSRSR